MIGILLSFIAICFGVGTGIIVRLLSDDLNIAMTLFYRFLFSLPLLLGIAIYAKGRDFWKINAKGTLALRVTFGMGGIVFWFLSVRYLDLGLATAIMQSSVIYVAMLSPLVLKERVGIYRWSAVVIGLFGVIVISGALSSSFDKAIWLAVGGSLSGCGLQLALRKLGKSDAPASVASWYNFMGFVLICLWVIVIPDFWQVPAQSVWPYLILLGLLGSGLQICFTASFQYVDAVVVSTTRYLQVPMAAFMGFYLFDEVPTGTHYIGALLIVGASLVIVIREFQRRQSK